MELIKVIIWSKILSSVWKVHNQMILKTKIVIYSKVVELIKVIIWSWFKVEVLNLNYPFSGKHINPRDCLNSQLPVVV